MHSLKTSELPNHRGETRGRETVNWDRVAGDLDRWRFMYMKSAHKNMEEKEKKNEQTVDQETKVRGEGRM
jgi:hypothetical protein